MTKFCAFEYEIGPSTTTGHPNPTTNRMNTAGILAVFSSARYRDEWVNTAKDRTRKALTYFEVRRHREGIKRKEIDEIKVRDMDALILDLPSVRLPLQARFNAYKQLHGGTEIEGVEYAMTESTVKPNYAAVKKAISVKSLASNQEVILSLKENGKYEVV